MKSSSSFLRLFIFAVAVVFLQCLYPTTVAATCHPDDEAGLLAFKSGITQDPLGVLSSWKKGTDCCSSWEHIFCNEGTQSRVNYLNLDGQLKNGEDYIDYTLSGTISPSLAKLQHLDTVYLMNLKNITGSFPQFIFGLPKLDILDIRNNRFSGPLPTNIGTLSKLSTLGLKGNRFTGPIPSSLSKLPPLSYLDLSGNLLTGTIPLEFANLKNMVSLSLSNNHLSGTIPDIFKSMNSLANLELTHNRFSGELPPSMASLPPGLTFLELGHNDLSGTIPSYLSRFKSLKTLDLSWNRFSGVVPKSLANLTEITILDLSHNLLTDPFPVLNLKDLHTLDLSYNKFHLKTIPTWVTSQPYLTVLTLKLAKCGIEMSLNDWKRSETALFSSIDLSENQISGSPAKLLKEHYLLKEFRASGNKLRFDIGKLSSSNSLETLDLSRNLVFGKVPAMVAGLKTLNLSQNHLCGKLPVTKFPMSAFANNDCLCGSPLPSCKLQRQ